MRVTYFCNDLFDVALERRVRMLRMGGADVTLIGFRRSEAPIHEVEGVAAVDLGRTFDRRLASRAVQVLQRSIQARKWSDAVSGADVLLARNLEMAIIASAARLWARSDVPLAYECLDIHDTVVGSGPLSMLLRSCERRILRGSATLIVSSPAYITNYFECLGIDLPNVILMENKQVPSMPIERPQCTFGPRRPPWRIGWLGYLRCAESFGILLSLAQRQPDLVDVELRGRPSNELAALIARHLPLPNMRFGGSYAQTELSSIYRACDLSWAVDYFQDGRNSAWCLPNRIYEGGFHNRPAIARAGTTTAAWLKARETGVLLQDPRAELESFIAGLTPAHYNSLQRSSAGIPTSDFVWTTEDCQQFARRITGN